MLVNRIEFGVLIVLPHGETNVGMDLTKQTKREIDQKPGPIETDLKSIVGLFASGGSDIATERHEAVRRAVAEGRSRTELRASRKSGKPR